MAGTSRTRVGEFELVSKIGEGSLGTVFEGVCLAGVAPPLAPGLRVALKRLHPAADPPRETRALAALDHPHIVRFLGAFTARPGEWDEAPFLVTELLEGADLGVHLAAHPDGLPWGEAHRILDQALDALAYAEAHGVIHRDLKPSNLFLCKNGTLKVIDFGLARKTGGTVSVSAGSGTRTGLTGTLDYMAPEFARVDGFRGDVRSDLFSFGVLACQVLAGRLPFPPFGEHPEIAFIRRWTGPKPPRALVPRPVAYAWEGSALFLARCLNPDREGRFPSFQAAREALAAIRPRVLAGQAALYTFEAFLASGGFCDVFRARTESGRAVAIKRLHAGRHEWRFRREAGLLQALQALDHPALLRIHELVEEPGEGGAPCLVMDYLPGADLRRRLAGLWETGRGLPVPEAVRLFIRYLEGLEVLHANGIAHRDLKPANLYAPEGKPEEGRLLDLGVACEQDGTVSMQGMPPGTLDYMAPELARGAGGRGTPQSDLYALGCSLYEALTGRPALKRLPAEDTAALRALCDRSETGSAFAAALEGFEAPVFRERPELVDVIARSVCFDPEKRYGGGLEQAGRWTGAGAREMRQALESLAAVSETPAAPAETVVPDDPPGEAPPTSDATVTVDGLPAPRRRRAGLILLAAGLLAASAFGLRRCVPEKETPVPAPAAIAPAPAAVTAGVPSAGAVTTAVPPVGVAPGGGEAALAPAPAPESPRVVIRPKPASPAAAVPSGPSHREPPAPAPAPAVPPAVPAPVAAGSAAVPEAELTAAEASIADWRRWLSRLDDPLTSVTLRRFQPGAAKPAWRGTLPYLLAAERDALPGGLGRRVERIQIWEQAAADLAARKAIAPRAEALRLLADKAEAVDPDLAGQCRFEARLLAWDGRQPAAGEFPGLAEADAWKAHARAAEGDDQEAAEVLAGLAALAGRAGAEWRAEDALLAVRAADLCLARAVAEVRDKTPADVVEPGTGRAVRNPVAAYAAAVGRLRGSAETAVAGALQAAKATGPEAAAGMKARVEQDRNGSGGYVWAADGWKGTSWEAVRTTGMERAAPVSADDAVILDHLLGRRPLPVKGEEIPVARLRGA